MSMLAFGLGFSDLYRREGLQRVDEAFLSVLRARDGGLADRLIAARQTALPGAKDEAALLVALSPHLDASSANSSTSSSHWPRCAPATRPWPR
jgi:hypothetical protein